MKFSSILYVTLTFIVAAKAAVSVESLWQTIPSTVAHFVHQAPSLHSDECLPYARGDFPFLRGRHHHHHLDVCTWISDLVNSQSNLFHTAPVRKRRPRWMQHPHNVR